MLLISVVALTVYLGFALWLMSGLRSAIRRQPPPDTHGSPRPFSVILAAHNEEDAISAVLASLAAQDYPAEAYQIILVADRCTDRTVERARRAMAGFPDFHLLEIEAVPEDMPPKKYALQQGVALARYSRLVLMDADCTAGPRYLHILNDYFAAGAQVVVNIPKGKVKPGLLHDYLLPERLLTWSIAAAGVGHRRPFLAFGGSWAYTRRALDTVGGFGGISASLSGDDDLLIYRMGKAGLPSAVCLNPEGWVTTDLPDSFAAFLRQRRRHHSAGKYYTPAVQAGYAAFHLANVLLWLLPLLTPAALWLLAGKIAVDYLALKQAGRLFRETLRWQHYAAFEIGYLLQHLIVAPSAFIGKIRW